MAVSLGAFADGRSEDGVIVPREWRPIQPIPCGPMRPGVRQRLPALATILSPLRGYPEARRSWIAPEGRKTVASGGSRWRTGVGPCGLAHSAVRQRLPALATVFRPSG